MARHPWLKLGKKTDPEIVEKPPIRLGNFSNGEFFHEQTPLEKKIERDDGHPIRPQRVVLRGVVVTCGLKLEQLDAGVP